MKVKNFNKVNNKVNYKVNKTIKATYLILSKFYIQSFYIYEFNIAVYRFNSEEPLSWISNSFSPFTLYCLDTFLWGYFFNLIKLETF